MAEGGGEEAGIPPPDLLDRFQEFTGKGQSKINWRGFMRAKEAKTKRKYDALCQYCFTKLDGRVDLLQKHRDICVLMPEELKIAVPPPAPSASKVMKMNIEEKYKGSPASQEDSDFLMGMAIVTGGVPYR